MRQLSFIGYLESYLKDVSGTSSLSVHKLSILLKKNFRIRDSLILYCALTGKETILDKYTNNEYHDVVSKLNESNILDSQFEDYEFKKIYDGYLNRTKVKDYDNEIKKEIRKKIIKYMDQKFISNYRVYTDLKMNPGNINDFLTNANCNKVSLDTVKRIYSYVENQKVITNSRTIVLTIDQIKKRILPILHKHNIFEIYLFGSYARGEATRRSDVDIYCEPGNIRSFFDQTDLEKELKTTLGKDVDVIFTDTELDDYFEEQLRKDMIKLC